MDKTSTLPTGIPLWQLLVLHYSIRDMKAFTNRDRFLLVASLMVTQTIGWGTTFSQIGILAQPISDDIGLSRGIIFGGATAMYIGASLSAPLSGRLADRLGGLQMLWPGSIAIAFGLIWMSLNMGAISYLASWLAFGLVLHVGLVTAAYSGLTQVLGAGAGRAISTLTLATGLCSSIFWPISELGLHYVDWRELLQIYAAVTFFICCPVHLWLYLRYGHLRAGSEFSAVPEAKAHILEGSEKPGFRLQTILASCGSFITVGFGIAVIDIFQQLGTPREDAVFAGSLMGITYLIGRGFYTVWADRFTPIQIALVVFVALPLSFVPLLVCATMGIPLPTWLAVAVSLAFGLPAGLVGILRSIFPLYMFGSAVYGRIFGRQSRATELASAASPMTLSWLIGISMSGALSLLLVAGGVGLFCASRIGNLTDKEKA